MRACLVQQLPVLPVRQADPECGDQYCVVLNAKAANAAAVSRQVSVLGRQEDPVLALVRVGALLHNRLDCLPDKT